MEAKSLGSTIFLHANHAAANSNSAACSLLFFFLSLSKRVSSVAGPCYLVVPSPGKIFFGPAVEPDRLVPTRWRRLERRRRRRPSLL